MRIQPRQQLLEIWRATAGYSYDRHSNWRWGGRHDANSISDAQQLLCIMLPATELPRFRLDKPDETDEEMLAALADFGDAMDIPQLLTRMAIDYFTRYSRPDGTPVFSGGGLLSPENPDDLPTEEQVGLDVVESFASSIMLTLASLGFAKAFFPEVTRADLQQEVTTLVQLANRRLSAAMVGLLRSFTINDFDYTSEEGGSLLRMVNQSRRPARRVAEALRLELRETAAGLRDFNIGIERVWDLDRPGRLFECGWSWGITTGAPVIDFAINVGQQREGYALDKPYLYFTVVAVDAIAELCSDRTRLLGLLDEDQSRLANALRLRWDLTQRYWATIASFDERRWPLEDIPWLRVDLFESDYFSLLVTAIAARDLALRRDTDADLSRLGRVLVELAQRGRITRRPFKNDPAVVMHMPGVSMPLEGTEDFGPPLQWVASDFAPLLLKLSLFVASLINDIQLRRELLVLADEIWDHMAIRRFDDGAGKDLWDQPVDAFPGTTDRFDKPSWHHTVRVVESLTIVARMADSHPLRSPALAGFAWDLLAEAEHLFDQELLGGSPESGRAMRNRLEATRQRLRHCREIIDDRPGSAAAVLLNVLKDLDDLAAARQDVLGVS